jgi:predicted dehydrogenase
MVEMSFSYNATSREPRTHFQYELIGSDGVIRYNREEHSFELRNSHGTQWLAWHPEKNFSGMHWEFAHALSTGDLRDMPTAMDGLLATRIARLATEEAIRDREPTSSGHPSTMARASSAGTTDIISPLDLKEPDDTPPSTLSTLFERTKQ